jgi:methyl-accepting chemotaxis protein
VGQDWKQGFLFKHYQTGLNKGTMSILSIFMWGQQVFNDPLCFFYLIAQTVLFFGFGLYIILPVRKRRRQLQGSNRQLVKNLASTMITQEIRFSIENNLIGKIAWLKGHFTDFSSAWKEACGSNLDKAAIPVRVKDYLTPTIVLDGARNQRLAAALPGIFVSIGIFGTFLGLVLGLSGLEFGPLAKNQNNVTTLINGLSLAFSTSLFGILYSIVFSLIYRLSITDLERSLLLFDDLIAKVFPYSSQEDFAVQYLEIQKDIKQGIQTLATDLALKLAETIGPAVSDAVEQKLIPSLDRIFDLVSESFEENRNSQSRFMEETMTQYSSLLNNNFKDQFKDIAEVFKETIGVQEEIREQMISFTANMQKQFESQEQLIEKTGRAGHLLNESLESLSTISKELKDSANNVSEAATLLQESAEKAKEGHQMLNETMEKQILTIGTSQEKFEKSWDDITDNTEGVVELIRASIAELGVGIGENLSKALELYDSKIAEVAERFSGTLFEANQTIEELPQLMNQLEEVLQASNAGFESQKELISVFGDSIGNLVAPNIEQARQTAESFQETSRDLKKTTSMLMSISADMQKSIKDSLEDLIESLKPFEDGGALYALFTELNGNLEKVALVNSKENLSFEEPLTALNDNLLKVVNYVEKVTHGEPTISKVTSKDQISVLNNAINELGEKIGTIPAGGSIRADPEVLDNCRVIISTLERIATEIGRDSQQLLTKVNESAGSIEGAINTLNESMTAVQSRAGNRKGFLGRIVGR